MLTLAIPGGLLLLGKAVALPIVGVLAVVALSLDLARSHFEVLNRFIVTWLGFMMRPTEQDVHGGTARLNGATWVLIGAALCIWLYPERIAAAALCMFLIGDAAAALIGRRWGTHKLPGSNKTVEGSLGFLLVAVAFGLFLPGSPVVIGISGAIAATGAEALPVRINDNLVVPIVAGLTMILVAGLVHP